MSPFLHQCLQIIIYLVAAGIIQPEVRYTIQHHVIKILAAQEGLIERSSHPLASHRSLRFEIIAFTLLVLAALHPQSVQHIIDQLILLYDHGLSIVSTHSAPKLPLLLFATFSLQLDDHITILLHRLGAIEVNVSTR